MLRMSKLTDYGTVVMTYLAREPDRVHNAAEVASNIHVPQATVSKILKVLARGNLLTPQRGAKGGYSLSRQPSPARVTTKSTAKRPITPVSRNWTATRRPSPAIKGA